MTHGATLLLICSLLLAAGCTNVNTVEHGNVCIDLSPDGKTVVFSSADGDLYLFDISKSVATRLTETERNESYPSFSPDGRQIAFAARENDSAPSRIYVLELESHSITAVTQSDKQSDILPRFTSDGEHIVFARAYQHRPYSLGGWTWDMWDVCSVGVDGSGLSRLTEEGYYQLYRIIPRSDGTFVYAADLLGFGDDQRAVLHTVSPNGKPTQLIPESGTHNKDVNAWASDPMVAPDGTTIAYCSDRTEPFWYDVCVQSDNAECACLVGSKSRYNRYPDFFPDGQRIIFLAGTDFNASNRPIYSLWEVSLSGETRELATSDLFTEPTNWLSPPRAEPADAPESR